MTSMLAEPTTDNITPTAPLSADRIVLTGFMGAGKSTVGRLLAAELGWQFADVDAEVEERYGSTIAQMFSALGEAEFRRRESAVIARALGRGNVVIALGGGAPETLTNRLLLEQTTRTAVVFLDAPFEILFDRCVLQEGAAVRPLLMDADAAAQRFRQRAPIYRRCAKHHVSTADQHPQETVTAVLRLLRA
ncbi:shikimate kinase [Terriglobus roseus DSM 18391]|uniref:Shikimate kinase n=1 Tax=Terriglobus roseus (strain DSM 18391 / NRRL B-41598 / KBS 63) TaxID=926566 RepID=I3ZJP3_TERRK|nr:shikimate kinase [Terriglobus roseus]AFL89461.1 shikimate kinase [Terriglobus roseus DSM 18391]